MGEVLKQKKLGIGSLALLLSLIGILWCCNIQWLNNFCLGDTVLRYIGIPSWSNGLYGTHYTVLYGYIFFIPAFILGIREKSNLFATVGKWISGFFCMILPPLIIFFLV